MAPKAESGWKGNSRRRRHFLRGTFSAPFGPDHKRKRGEKRGKWRMGVRGRGGTIPMSKNRDSGSLVVFLRNLNWNLNQRNQKRIVFRCQFFISRKGRRNRDSQFLNLRKSATSSEGVESDRKIASISLLYRCFADSHNPRMLVVNLGDIYQFSVFALEAKLKRSSGSRINKQLNVIKIDF